MPSSILLAGERYISPAISESVIKAYRNLPAESRPEPSRDRGDPRALPERPVLGPSTEGPAVLDIGQRRGSRGRAAETRWACGMLKPGLGLEPRPAPADK